MFGGAVTPGRILAVQWRDLTRAQKLAVGLGVALLLVALAALAWTFFAQTPTRGHLPGYALQSTLVFKIERAVILTAGFALIGVFCARLLAGDLPSGITARGVEWKGEDNLVAVLNKASGSVEDVRKASANNAAAIEKLRNELTPLGTLANEVTATLSQAQLSVEGVRQVNEVHTEVIRIIAEELESLTPLQEQVVQLLERAQELSGTVTELAGRVSKLE
jgi:hypothetical protein